MKVLSDRLLDPPERFWRPEPDPDFLMERKRDEDALDTRVEDQSLEPNPTHPPL